MGGTGNDTLYGDAGNDTLDGGVGTDWIVFRAGDGQDRLDNISYSQGDRIVLEAGQGYSLESFAGGGRILLDSGDTLTVYTQTWATYNDEFIMVV